MPTQYSHMMPKHLWSHGGRSGGRVASRWRRRSRGIAVVAALVSYRGGCVAVAAAVVSRRSHGIAVLVAAVVSCRGGCVAWRQRRACRGGRVAWRWPHRGALSGRRIALGWQRWCRRGGVVVAVVMRRRIASHERWR
jgi:hypothetical protein